MSERAERTARATAVCAVLLALLAVVALASGRDRPSVSGTTDPGSVAEVRDVVLTVGLTLYAIAFAALVWLIWRFRGGDRGPGPRRSILAQLGIVLVASVFLWGIKHRPNANTGFEELAFGPPKAESQEQAQPPQRELPPAEFRWHVAAGLVALMVTAAGAVLIVRRRHLVADELGPLSQREAAAAELATMFESTLDDVRREADPRRAVIAAYAHLERVLSRHGLPRERSEAPFEYLARMLAELRVRPGSALALTELFERARFSEHTIDPAMKDEAIEALIAVRDDLLAQ
jgi:hypothetical protein